MEESSLCSETMTKLWSFLMHCKPTRIISFTLAAPFTTSKTTILKLIKWDYQNFNSKKTYIRNQTPSASHSKNCKNLFGKKWRHGDDNEAITEKGEEERLRRDIENNTVHLKIFPRPEEIQCYIKCHSSKQKQRKHSWTILPSSSLYSSSVLSYPFLTFSYI